MRVLSEIIHTKTVEYFGCTLNVPENVNYLATDFDGKVFGYFFEPGLEGQSNWSPASDDENWCELAEVDLEGVNWTKSLVKVV